MRVVYEAGNLIDAYLVRHALEDAGIPVFVRGEALLGGVGELPACGLLAVCVPGICWSQAQAVIESLPLLAGEVGDADGVPLVDRALPA
jgi:hypothetical protein